MKRKKILIIEDDQVLRKSFQKLLKDEGYIVNTTNNGEAAISKIKHTYYNLIYTGILMPKLDGLSLLEYLQKNKVKHGKIVIFSNLSNKTVITKAYELGADEYVQLSKINMEQGLDIMKKLLKARSSK